jgi:transcriptional regulator of acetoin/glycerol metabolism
MKMLVAYDWPGNVRELENELRRIAALAGDGIIESHLAESLAARRSAPARGSPYGGKTLEEIEQEAIREALERYSGNRSEAARSLGLPRRTFYNRLRKYGIE